LIFGKQFLPFLYDEGAIWKPGELFYDEENNIAIGIVNQTKSGFWVEINPSITDLSVTKFDNVDFIREGDRLTYKITVQNNGPDKANNIKIIDTLPYKVKYNNYGKNEICDQGEKIL
jgi:uncharacterized repeat protein (TIGR01451 family)